MNATLNVYEDCTSDKPIKTYTCKRLLLKVSIKVQALSEKINGKSAAEQQELMIDILKTIFPNFEDADFDGLDPSEYKAFIAEIGKETALIQGKTLKN